MISSSLPALRCDQQLSVTLRRDQQLSARSQSLSPSLLPALISDSPPLFPATLAVNLDPLSDTLFPPQPLSDTLFPPQPLSDTLFPPQPLSDTLFPPQPLSDTLFPPQPL